MAEMPNTPNTESISSSDPSPSKIWKHDLTSEISNGSEAASNSLLDNYRPNIGHSYSLSINKADLNAILLPQPVIDNLDSWRLHVQELKSSSNTTPMPNSPSLYPFVSHYQVKGASNEVMSINPCGGFGLLYPSKACTSNSPPYLRSCSISEGILTQNIDSPVREEWVLSVAATRHERHGDRLDMRILQKRHDTEPVPRRGLQDVLESTTDPDSWRLHITEMSPAPIDTVKPSDGQICPKVPCAVGSRAPVRNDSLPPSAASALCMDSRGAAEQHATSTCIHGRRRTRCAACQGTYVCSHGRVKSQCRVCGGPSFCLHGRRKTACKDCGGSLFCGHGRQKSRCKDCGGVAICGHGRRKAQCKDCGGADLCCHGRRRSTCVPCGGASVCAHARQKSRCKDCARGARGAPN